MEVNNITLSIPVTKCSAFVNDPNLNMTKEALCEQFGNQWEKILHPIAKPQTYYISSNVDTAFFHPIKFEVIIDARGFDPQSICVNVTADQVDVSASQSPHTLAENGCQQRTYTMTRTYQLPKHVAPQYSTCKLTDDGYLIVSAPWIF